MEIEGKELTKKDIEDFYLSNKPAIYSGILTKTLTFFALFIKNKIHRI